MMQELRLTPTEEDIIIRMCNYNFRDSWENLSDGWMKREQIEHDPAPYTPNKRWDYLDYSLTQGKVKVQTGKKSNGKMQWKDQTHEEKELIEIKDHSYKDKYKRSHSEKVYRIIRSQEIFFRLFQYFKRVNKIYIFIQSDYYKDSFELKVELGLYWKDIINKKNQKIKLSAFMSKIFDETEKIDPKVIPPSFTEWILMNTRTKGVMYEDDFYFNEKKIVADLGISEIFEAFLISDILACPDPNIQNGMIELLNQIKNKKKEVVKKDKKRS